MDAALSLEGRWLSDEIFRRQTDIGLIKSPVSRAVSLEMVKIEINLIFRFHFTFL